MTELQLSLSPKEASEPQLLKNHISKLLKVPLEDITAIQIVKKSVDSRKRNPIVLLKVNVYINESPQFSYQEEYHYNDVSNGEKVIIVGAGPAGLFAALRLIEHGYCPIILERGKSVSERKKDIALLNRNQALNTESNYCFGEGGAGTFSDGKLYTRSKKRGTIQRILEIFHMHGAQDEILYEAHPHIGTDRLPVVITAMRETIERCGGSVLFNHHVNNIEISNSQVQGVSCSNGAHFLAKHIILATGHSARDIYQLLHNNNITLEAKGFAMGVRAEHPQSLIDSIQYHSPTRNPYLPTASYALVAQVDGRGVYSFCMCPGGHIVPSATEHDHLVVNGMSASKRNSPYANSGIVVEIHPEDLTNYQQYGPLCGLRFQEDLERLCKAHNQGEGQKAPAQRLADFVNSKPSRTLPPCSYLPGIITSPLHEWLPPHIGKRLQEGFKQFDRKMKGYLTNEAVIVAVESRSSSPVRIPRDSEQCQHLQIKGLYPCGEGSGYAGGITSSAMDGEKCANAIAKNNE